jgi:SAM-dependent methyltransferase
MERGWSKLPPGSDYGIEVLLVALDDWYRFDVEIDEFRRRGIVVIVPDNFAVGTRESELFKEAAFHDAVSGGYNEATHTNSGFANEALISHSRKHSRRLFPSWAFAGLPDAKLLALDLKSGPISHLRWGQLNGFLDVVCVDPLLPAYQLIMARHGLDKLEGPSLANGVAFFSESVSACIPEETFDFVYSANGIDTAVDPLKLMFEVHKVMKTSSRFAVSVPTRSGTNNNWEHPYISDIFLDESGAPVFRRQDNKCENLIPPGLELERIHESSEHALMFTLVKKLL